MGKLINIDNGGTLTDIWVLDGEKSYHTKTITTPYDLSKCFYEGLKKVSGLIYGDDNLAALLQSTDHIRYSTTQGTNALVEKKGPKVGLILDSGIDVAVLRKTEKESQMFEAIVGSRVNTIDCTDNEQEYQKFLTEAVSLLSSSGASRIVVASSGPDYLQKEAKFRRVSLKVFPRHLLGAVPILYAGNLSSDRSPKRRVWTAINNAFLHPVMERFLYNAENKLRDYRTKNPLLIYRNDGFSGRVAKTVAIKTYSSGPRAGMDSAKAHANYYGFARCITMDVGGTTTDIGLVENGIVKDRRFGDVEGIECSFPLSDIVSIGVGGGSIFRVKSGEIMVGPDSVGGAPGPACFSMGGKEATITDALLLIGLLNPKTYFGGDMRLDIERARQAISNNVASPLAISPESAAHKMLDAWAQAIVEELKDYNTLDESTVLSAYGGGGPMGVVAVAEAAGVKKILVPRLSAVFSAHGIGFSDIAHTHEAKLEINNLECLKTNFAQLLQKVERDMFSEGFSLDQCEIESWLLVNGEKFLVDINSPDLINSIDANDEIVVGVRGIRAVNKASLPATNGNGKHEAREHTNRSFICSDESVVSIPVIRVEDQLPGATANGPVILEEAFWTCKVDVGWCAEFTENRDVILTKNS